MSLILYFVFGGEDAPERRRKLARGIQANFPGQLQQPLLAPPAPVYTDPYAAAAPQYASTADQYGVFPLAPDAYTGQYEPAVDPSQIQLQ